MASLRAKKEINKLNKKKTASPINIVKTLPNELLVEIIGKVASHSMADLCQMKLSCKDFLNASEDGHVYQHASMENFALIPLTWFTNEKQTSFLRRCRENDNLEILYREGMVQYFSTSMVNLGFEKLKKAALQGHHEAKYVYSILLMANCEEDEGRELGFDLFGKLKNSTCNSSVARCRKRVKSFIKSMWVKNHVVVQNMSSCCCSDTCVGTEELKKHSTWSADEVDNDGVGVSCKYCDGNYELGLFARIFST